MYPALPIQQLAGEAGAASCPRGRDPESSIEPGITWYDVLGALPGAEARKIKQKYDAKAALLRPELISGAPPNVLTAVMRAQELLDTAWELLGDPDSRKRYDEAVGFRRSGGGLGQPGTGIESAGMDAVGGLLALTGWLGPQRRRNRPGAVPDVRGLFFPVGLEVATRRGLRVRIVQLTEHAMAVDGLVVDQDPRPPTKAHRGDKLTMHVWHPPARSRTFPGGMPGGRGTTPACLRVLGQVVDHLDDLAVTVTLLPGELQQVPDSGEDGTALGCAGHCDAMSAAELQESFLAQDPQRAQDGVLVHPEHRRQVLGQRQALARAGLAVGDGPADLRGDLLVQRDRSGAVNVDIQHGARHSSSMENARQGPRRVR